MSSDTTYTETAAHASVYHWRYVGTIFTNDLNRGKWHGLR